MSGKQQKNSGAKKTDKGSKQTIAAKYYADAEKKIIADAPYNFISLPTDICAPHKMWNNPKRSTAPVMIEDEEGKLVENVEATKQVRKTICETYNEYIQKYGQYSGYIELAIKTTRDTLVGMPDKEIDKKTGKEKEISTFFSIKNNEPMIPGSSLRGMTRNLFKIMTASSFRANEDFNERVLYYRDIASGKDSDEIKDDYSKNHYNNEETNIFGGFLVRIRTSAGETKWNIYRDPNVQLKNNGQAKTANHTTVDWKVFDEAIENISKQSTVPTSLKCKVKVNLIPNSDGPESNEYVLTWDCKETFVVEESIIQAYLDDARRGKNSINLLYKRGKEDTYGVRGGALESTELEKLLGVEGVDMIAPCFFVLNQDTGTVKHFGHTKYYRIPYNYSIADHVPSNLKTNYVDFTDLVFGLKEFWGGRVYFGDAVLERKDENKIFRDEPIESILLGANPTSYQMYLEQKKSNKRTHWNSEKAMIRGVKQYWHRDKITSYLPENNSNVVSKLSNIVKGGNLFNGKVYFKNLTKEELGALCKVLFTATGDSEDKISRNKSRRFKIGKGKSIGLGSIDIQSTLFLEPINEYSQENIWTENGIMPLEAIPLDTEEQNVDTLINGFNDYVKSTMSVEAWETLDDSLTDLYEMMVWKGINESFDARTVHMPIKDDPNKRFVKRTALLEPKLFKNFK